MFESPIREIRKNWEFSTQEFAELCGVSVSSANCAENGVGRLPTQMVFALADLGVDTETLHHQYAAFRQAHAVELRDRALRDRTETEVAP